MLKFQTKVALKLGLGWRSPRLLEKLFALGLACTLAIALLVVQPMPALAQPLPLMASLFSFAGQRPDNLGIDDGKLAPCPESPNCVSSYARDVVHRIDPFTYEGSGEEALAEIQSLIENTDNAKVVYSSDDYLYAEYTSNILGFVDDVEFYLDKEAEAIQVRSASRLGQSDLGVNRQRIETIRSQYEDF